MGNSGSIHNLNIEGATSELNSYFQAQSQPLRKSGRNRELLGYNYGHKNATSLLRAQPPPSTRHSKDWRRSLANPCDLKEYNIGPEHPTQFKVLPKVNERLHLRATTNGAILYSGGTISGRKEERVPTSKSPALPVGVGGMQRSRTFIYEPTKDGNDMATDRSRTPEFHRSQTLLNIKVKADKSYLSANKGNSNTNNLKAMQKHTHSEPDFGNNNSGNDTHNKSEKQNGKVNKYNKKRRAPQAPNTTLDASPTSLPVAVTSEKVTPNPQKQQLFTKNNSRSKASIINANEPSESNAPARRSHEKKSLPLPLAPQSTSTTETLRTTLQTRIPYRREKSSDAILLKSQSDKLKLTEAKHEPKLRMTPEPTRITKTLEQRKSLDDNLRTTTTTEHAEKTKIPQLKRTFYFGMDITLAKPRTQPVPMQASEQRSMPKKKQQPENNNSNKDDDEDALASMPYIPSYDINIDKSADSPDEINDNGLMVHIRPTLPRRQLDTPTFNPILAWRSLIEDQENLQRRTIKNAASSRFNDKRSGKSGGGDGGVGKTDSPIQPKLMPKLQPLAKSSLMLNTWTPEQDLGDEDDENEAATAAAAATSAVVVGEETSSDDCQSEIDGNGLLFYGSKIKKSEQYPKQVSSPVHLFSLSLPRDTHLDGMPAEKQSFNYSSLQKMDKVNRVGQSSSGVGVGYEFGRLSSTKYDGSNNWLLHKNIPDSANTTKTHINKPTDVSSNTATSSYPSIEPMSLKFLTAGKHVMYLPCNYEQEKPAEAKNAPAPTNSQPRQSKRRQRELRENLQDPTPIFPTNQSSDNEKPLHQRFTFQSTVRLLEKRRLADKLSKDAEIKEAQRKSELVALERVEEDFQRKRANEKANIRYQLRLYFGGNNEECKERYQSLPITNNNNSQTINDYVNRQFNDDDDDNTNSNNICCRDEPDGCVATPQSVSSDNELMMGSKSSYARK